MTNIMWLLFLSKHPGGHRHLNSENVLLCGLVGKCLLRGPRDTVLLSFTRLLVMFCIYEKFNPLSSKVYGHVPSKEEVAAFLISRHKIYTLGRTNGLRSRWHQRHAVQRDDCPWTQPQRCLETSRFSLINLLWIRYIHIDSFIPTF